MAATLCGVTVSVPAIPNFDRLPFEEVTAIVYNQVIPAAVNCPSIEVYHREKVNYELFDIEKI
jgi:hypothetical protein